MGMAGKAAQMGRQARMRDNGGSGGVVWPKVGDHHREAILSTKLHWYPTAEHAHADWLTVADDAVAIRIGIWIGDVISFAEAVAEGAPLDPSEGIGKPAVSCAESSEQEGSPPGQKRIYTLQGRERIKNPEQHYQRPLRL
jgi:hypothetical protein